MKRHENELMLLYPAVREWTVWCHAEKGMSAATRTCYGSYMRRFLRWAADAQGVGEHSPIADFTPSLVRGFIQHVTEVGLRPRSIRGLFNPLRSFGNWLVDNQMVDESPISKITMPKKDAAIRKLVTDEEVGQLLTGCLRLSPERHVRFAHALISVFAFTGLRRTEVLSLNVEDLSLSEGLLVVVSGKGGKRRELYPPQECLDSIRAWLALRAKMQPVHNGLWAITKTRALGVEGLSIWLKRIKAAAGLADHDNIHPHALRRNFATRVLENGGNIRDVQTMLGHAQVTTTMIYTNVDSGRLKRIREVAGLVTPSPPLPPKIEVSTRTPGASAPDPEASRESERPTKASRPSPREFFALRRAK